MDSLPDAARVPEMGDDPAATRDAALAQVAAAAAGIAEGFRTVIPGVVEVQVRTIVRAWGRLDPAQRRAVHDAARAAGLQAGADVAAAWEAEAAKPLHEQRRGPLEFLRDVRQYPTAVLAAAGIPPVRRDRFATERFPDDVYGLIVERFADLPGGAGGELQALHLLWGTGKALWVKAEQAVRRGSGP